MTDATKPARPGTPLPRRGKGSRILIVAALAGGLFAAFLASPQELTQRQVLDATEIALAVKSLDGRPEDAKAGTAQPGPDRHRLKVTLTHRERNEAVAGAQVTVNVAKEGYAGTDYALVPAIDGEPGVYSAVAGMPGRSRYRLLVHFRIPGDPRVREALFWYTHHH